MVKTKLILGTTGIINILGPVNKLKNKYKIGTDSRHFKYGSCFLAIKGQNYDGFDYVESIINDADLFIFESTDKNKKRAIDLFDKYPGKVFVFVENSVLYCQELARIHVTDWITKGKEIIAISGSNGKTTTKEMLWHILISQNKRNVLKTEKNNNNHLGVPFTLFRINEEIDYAVVEYGSNHPGEMKVICECSHPTMGITTNIGDTHMEFFPDLEAVFQEESLVCEYILKNTDESGFYLINQDDNYLSGIKRYKNFKTFSSNDDADYVYKYNRKTQSIFVNNVEIKNSNILGEHNFINLANAFVLALSLYPTRISNLIAACESFRPTENRSQWRNWRNSKVFMDAYNANPSSMKIAASEFYKNFCEKYDSNEQCLLILGDMKELGKESARYHEDLGRLIKTMDRAQVVYIGSHNEDFKKGYKKKLFTEKAQSSLNSDELLRIEKFPWIFVKASRSLQLESVLDIKEGTA